MTYFRIFKKNKQPATEVLHSITNHYRV